MKTGITKLVVVFAAVAVLGSGYIVENENSVPLLTEQFQSSSDEAVLLASRYPMRNRTPDFFSRSKGSKSNRRT